MKKLLVKIRTSLKFLILLIIATMLIVGAVIIIYKPIYSVYLNGNLIGYCKNKTELQSKISEYVEKGDGSNENLAFVSIDKMPTYKMCLLKRDKKTNDDEIFETVKKTGVPYYKYFAILDEEEEKAYVADFKQAESVVNKLKEKESDNIDDISIKEKYETKIKDFSNEDDIVSNLYEEKKVEVAEENKEEEKAENSEKEDDSSSNKTVSKNGNTKVTSTTGKLRMSYNLSQAKPSIGISLIKPITGTITSRFASISRVRTGAHTGLDIAAVSGTPIKAAASGTVSFSGVHGGYGNLVVITHGNGVQTFYGHCSKRYVTAGTKVSQGDVIAAVGTTGNSTGPHLHLEVRVDGVAYNPQFYVY